MATKNKRLPKGFRRGHDDSLACPHRDVSCCDECVETHPEIVDAFGACYWVPDERERAELRAMAERMRARLNKR